MRVFALVQALIAVALLLSGLVALWSLGITGLVLLLPAVGFAAIAGLALNGGRAGLLLALAADAGVGLVAWHRLLAPPPPAPFPAPGPLDVGVPAFALALVLLAMAGLLRDWRSVRAVGWFSSERRVHTGGQGDH